MRFAWCFVPGVFWANALANAVGSAIGVSLGLFYDRWKERKARAEREETRRRQHREQEATQLRIIEWLVNENVDLCKQVLAAVRADQPFYFRMNTHLLDASLVTLSTLTTDPVLLLHAEHYRYQLHHLNGKIDSFREAREVFQGGHVSEGALLKVLDRLRPLIPRQSEGLIAASAPLLRLLRSRIDALEVPNSAPIPPASALVASGGGP